MMGSCGSGWRGGCAIELPLEYSVRRRSTVRRTGPTAPGRRWRARRQVRSAVRVEISTGIPGASNRYWVLATSSYSSTLSGSYSRPASPPPSSFSPAARILPATSPGRSGSCRTRRCFRDRARVAKRLELVALHRLHLAVAVAVEDAAAADETRAVSCGSSPCSTRNRPSIEQPEAPAVRWSTPDRRADGRSATRTLR